MSTCLYLLLDTCWSKEYKLYLCAVLPVLFTLCSASSPTLSTVASYDLQDCHNTVMTYKTHCIFDAIRTIQIMGAKDPTRHA
eukprot:scaffold177599_cov26-Tisochrysis_lutea.AAC.1